MNLQTKKRAGILLRAGVLLLTFLFLLLLSRGFVTSSDDWYFSERDHVGSLTEAFRLGVVNAKGHYRSLNGRLLGNGFSKFFGINDTFRELGRCTILFGILLLLVRAAKIRTPLMYMAALMLTVALPADIYAQSYAWAAGFFNYVPPLLVILFYLVRADRILSGGRDSAAFGVLMLAVLLTGQLFVENVTVGMCLFCGGVLVWHLIRSRKLSWSLTGAFLGAVLGCAIMFSAPGYANVNNEGYRQVSATFEELMKVVKANFPTITMYLTERNWTVIAPLTVLSVCLLLPVQTSGFRSFARGFALCGLMACPVWFFARIQLLKPLSYAEWIAELSFWMDVLFNVLYLLSVLTAAVLGLRDGSRMRRAVLCIAAVPMIFGPLVVVTPIGPRCMYIPYMLLVCIVLIFAAELTERLPRDRRRLLTVPVALTMVCVLTVYLWTAVWNGHCENVRISRIEAALEAGETSVVLPSYPYTAYVHNGNGGAIRYYYYHEVPCDLEFQFVEHRQWYLEH